MNKKFKKLLMAGLVTVITGTSIVQSSALGKETINISKTKGVLYLYINGKKHEIFLECNNKPLQDEDFSIEDNNSSDIDTDNNQGNTDSSTENDNINDSESNSFLSFQKEVVRLVNVERTKRGLSELSFNTQLSNVATLKSQDMINKNYFSHISPTYGSLFDMMKQFNISYKTTGENIAKGKKLLKKL